MLIPRPKAALPTRIASSRRGVFEREAKVATAVTSRRKGALENRRASSEASPERGWSQEANQSVTKAIDDVPPGSERREMAQRSESRANSLKFATRRNH